MKNKIMSSVVMLVMHTVCAGMASELQLNPMVDYVINKNESIQFLDSWIEPLLERHRECIKKINQWKILSTLVQHMKCSLGEMLTAEYYFRFLCNRWKDSILCPSNTTDENFAIDTIFIATISIVLAHNMLDDSCYQLGNICKFCNLSISGAFICEIWMLQELEKENTFMIPIEYYNFAAEEWAKKYHNANKVI